MIEIVETSGGRVKGVGSADGAVCSYKGIPYAKPPVGDLRWRPPQPPERWDGERLADSYSAIAPQAIFKDDSIYHGGIEAQSEDCLYLNVWTGASDPEERRPVMMFFHYGGFFGGSASAGFLGSVDRRLYDGEDLAKAGVILVSANYRVNRLGFLAHPWLSAESEHGASSNYGIMDQQAALRWVQENIAAFGGDPDCVTIFGVSAGSASTNLHTASPLSADLFHRAIGESGGFFGPPSPSTALFDLMQDLESAERSGIKLTEALGVSSLEELRSEPLENILTASIADGLGAWEMDSFPFPVGPGGADTSYPVVDGHVIPEPVYDIFAAGRQNDVPLITGSNAKEGAPMPGVPNLDLYIEEVRREFGDLADDFLRAYHATDDDEAFDVSADSTGDRTFSWHNWTWARMARAHGTQPVFYYHWEHPLPIQPGRHFAERRLGAIHAGEVPYVFRHLDVCDFDWKEYDRELSETISTYWTNFARTGDPNGVGMPDWAEFEDDGEHTMHFGESVEMGSIANPERLAVLDRFYESMRAAQAVTH